MTDTTYTSLPYKPPVSHNEKKKWLKENVDYNQMIEWALDDYTIISRLYKHFKEGEW